MFKILADMAETSRKHDAVFNERFGGLFRSGPWRLNTANCGSLPNSIGANASYFAYQTKRYADLYAGSFINLINYPFCYRYTANESRLPHERY